MRYHYVRIALQRLKITPTKPGAVFFRREQLPRLIDQPIYILRRRRFVRI